MPRPLSSAIGGSGMIFDYVLPFIMTFIWLFIIIFVISMIIYAIKKGSFMKYLLYDLIIAVVCALIITLI